VELSLVLVVEGNSLKTEEKTKPDVMGSNKR
jgi:hypothetical protein